MGISMVADSSLRCYVRAIIQVVDGLEEVFEERRPGRGKEIIRFLIPKNQSLNVHLHFFRTQFSHRCKCAKSCGGGKGLRCSRTECPDLLYVFPENFNAYVYISYTRIFTSLFTNTPTSSMYACIIAGITIFVEYIYDTHN